MLPYSENGMLRASPIMGVSPNRSAHEDDMAERERERRMLGAACSDRLVT